MVLEDDQYYQAWFIRNFSSLHTWVITVINSKHVPEGWYHAWPTSSWNMRKFVASGSLYKIFPSLLYPFSTLVLFLEPHVSSYCPPVTLIAFTFSLVSPVPVSEIDRQPAGSLMERRKTNAFLDTTALRDSLRGQTRKIVIVAWTLVIGPIRRLCCILSI